MRYAISTAQMAQEADEHFGHAPDMDQEYDGICWDPKTRRWHDKGNGEIISQNKAEERAQEEIEDEEEFNNHDDWDD